MLVWELIPDSCRIALCKYQFEVHGTILDWVDKKQTPLIDHIPEEQHLDRFMSQAPEHQAFVK